MGTCNTVHVPKTTSSWTVSRETTKKAPQSLTLPDILKIAKV